MSDQQIRLPWKWSKELYISRSSHEKLDSVWKLSIDGERAVLFSPDRKHPEEGELFQIWDLNKMVCLFSEFYYRKGYFSPRFLSISPNCEHIGFTDINYDRHVKMVTLTTSGKSTYRLDAMRRDGHTPLHFMTFSSDGKSFAYGNEERGRIVDLSTRKTRIEIPSLNASNMAPVFLSPKGDLLLILSDSDLNPQLDINVLKVFDLRKNSFYWIVDMEKPRKVFDFPGWGKSSDWRFLGFTARNGDILLYRVMRLDKWAYVSSKGFVDQQGNVHKVERYRYFFRILCLFNARIRGEWYLDNAYHFGGSVTDLMLSPDGYLIYIQSDEKLNIWDLSGNKVMSMSGAYNTKETRGFFSYKSEDSEARLVTYSREKAKIHFIDENYNLHHSSVPDILKYNIDRCGIQESDIPDEAGNETYGVDHLQVGLEKPRLEWITPNHQKSRSIASSNQKKSTMVKSGDEKNCTRDHLKKVLSVSTRIRIDMLRDDFLKMERADFADRLLEWAIEFGFKIDGEYIIIEGKNVDNFISTIDKMFEQWGEGEKSKHSKGGS